LFAGDPLTGQVEELRISTLGEPLVELDGGNVVSRQFILSIGQDLNGELYLVVGDDPQFPRALVPDGRILRILPVSGSGVPGDVNGDGLVMGDGTGDPAVDDVAAFVLGWGTTGHTSAAEQIMNGDLNLDGRTDFLDWFILRSNHPEGPSIDLASALAGVPEPAAAVLLAFGVVGISVLRQRWRGGVTRRGHAGA
jgi:hypothetical protein